MCILLSDKRTVTLNISFLACTKVDFMGPDSLYCGKWRKISKSHRELDLGRTMQTIELFQVIFIYYNVFQFCQVELRFSSCVCVYSQEKMCPAHLYHRVYLVDRNFLVQNYIFSFLPGTIRHSLVLQSK